MILDISKMQMLSRITFVRAFAEAYCVCHACSEMLLRRCSWSEQAAWATATCPWPLKWTGDPPAARTVNVE